MEIDITANRKKTAGKTEVEKMIDRAKVDKEPPLFPEIEKAILKIKDSSARNEREAGDALREPSQLLREAIQYYSNRMIPPGESRPAQEMAIIAVAAETIHRTIDKLILDGELGEGTIHFYRAMDALSVTVSTVGAISTDGKIAKAKFGIDPVSVVEKLDKLEGGSDNALELIHRKSRRFFDLLEKVGGGLDMSEVAFHKEVIRKVGQGDPEALEMLDELANIEDAWLKHTKLDNLRSTNGAIRILIILLERYSRRMRTEMGNDGFELLELLDAMVVGTCINQKDGGGGHE